MKNRIAELYIEQLKNRGIETQELVWLLTDIVQRLSQLEENAEKVELE